MDGEPGFKAELQALVLEHVDSPSPSDAQRAAGERIRERCESHAGLDINANDMLTSLARELLFCAFSSVDWPALAEKLIEEHVETGSMGRST
jgi:hypothetical protein